MTKERQYLYMTDFPDCKYIETIRQALWNGSEFGRAVETIVAEAPGLARPITADELIQVIDASIPERVSSEEKETLFATLTPLLQRTELAFSRGAVPLDEQIQLAALLVVRIAQTLSRAKAACPAIKTIVSRIVSSPRRLSNVASAELHRIAVRDDSAQPDETLLWLRNWTARTESRRKNAARSKKDKTPDAS